MDVRSAERLLEDLKEFAERVNKAFSRINPQIMERRTPRGWLREMVREYFENLGAEVLREACEIAKEDIRSYRELDELLQEIECSTDREEDVLYVRRALLRYMFCRTYTLQRLLVRLYWSLNAGTADVAELVGMLRKMDLFAEEAQLIYPVTPDVEDLREVVKDTIQVIGNDVGAGTEEEDDRLEPEPKLEVCVVRGKLPAFVDPDTGAGVPPSKEGDLLMVGETAARILSERGRRWGGPFAEHIRRWRG
ncbi:hypothetical protein [Methanopyrus sp.]